jgi:hypothetical protein
MLPESLAQGSLIPLLRDLNMNRLTARLLRALGTLTLLLGIAAPACASIGLVVGEPFGSFGTMMPVGHASIYLDHLCADGSTRIRACLANERPGVVIARYHDLTRSHMDWLATPAAVFFYGVDDPADTPTWITPALRDQLRLAYLDAHLRPVVPGKVVTRVERDGALHFKDGEDWQESIGAAFDRRLFLYTLATTPEQDEAVMAFVNDLPNRRRYSLFSANCANFAADVLRVVLPQQNPPILHPGKLADFAYTTPKSLARQIDAFGRQHPELSFAVYEVPQVPGTTRRSRPLRSSAELLLTTKRYLVTLSILQPEIVLADTVAFETKGRWTPGKDAIPLSPSDWPSPQTLSSPVASIDSDNSIKAND